MTETVNRGVQKPKVAISTDFLDAFVRVPRKQQNKVREFVDKFRESPTSPGSNYEKIRTASDPNMRSVRVGVDYRAIVLAPREGNLYILLWVDHHDEAYDWARKRQCHINPSTGSLQIVETVEIEAPAAGLTAEELGGGAAAREAVPAVGLIQTNESGSDSKTPLFARFTDADLLSLGIPAAQLPLVRALRTETDLDAQTGTLPEEAADALTLLAAGYSLEETRAELAKPQSSGAVDTTDFAAALETPGSKRRFYVVDDEQELKAILEAPLEKWRVFLHPSQRQLVERDWNGPVRVLGGAGTGKTVVAMHRAKWLAANRCTTPEDRVLLTTFTRNLAADIQANLAKICSPELLARIDVVNLDLWVANFLRQRGYGFQIDYGQRTRPLWDRALAFAPTGLNLSPAFYREEWESVIQAQGLASFTDYAKATRLGRGVRLDRRERKLSWAVFEAYRQLLDENSLREPEDAMRDARALLEQGMAKHGYTSILVDEAQDMSAEAFRLLRALVPAPVAEGAQRNDLFIVGDAHQRIYRHRVVLGRCGVNIRGRGRKLLINYRTTDENRRWATSLLEGVDIDDLDGESDDQRGYRSLLHGAPPEVHRFATEAEEHALIVETLRTIARQHGDLSGTCVVARTNQLVNQLQNAIAAAGLDTHPVERNESDDRRQPGVRLATMHRVKGLEFDRVIIAHMNAGIVPLAAALSQSEDEVLRQESEARERALLYVAATRARSSLILTASGTPSQLLA